MRLLVTRPEPDASAFAEELRGLGHDPVLEPLLEFRPLDVSADDFRGAQALIVTSGNCLRALEQTSRLKEAAALPLYCVGEATAKRAAALGFAQTLATAETAERLAAKIAESAREGASLLHLTGEHQAFDLAEALAREGLSVRTLPVYSMDARPQFSPAAEAMIRSGDGAGVILMSPRTAEIYVSLCHRHGLTACAKSLLYFCLSQNVAARLAALAPDRILVAEKPNRKALLDLVLPH